MQTLQKSIITAVIVSETTHIFCCVLPIAFSVFSLMVGTGVISAMPGFVNSMHHAIHDYEIPMIVASGVVLILGWVLYAISQKMNCQDDGCMKDHGDCAPRKHKTNIILIIATFLFMINVSVYFTFHAPMDKQAVHQGDHNHHHGHSH